MTSGDLRWLHLRLRLAGFRMRGLRKANTPAKTIKVPDAFEIGAREDWGRFLKRLDERLMSPDNYSGAPVAKTVAGVVTYGLNQLEPATVEALPDIAALDECTNGVECAGPGVPAHEDRDFVIVWHQAMCREMGADEVEKFALTLGEAHHDQGTAT